MTDLLRRSHDDWLRAAKELVPEGRMFVDGGFADAATGATFESRTPRDGSVLAHVARGDAADVDAAVRAARRAFDDGRWRDRSPRSRRRGSLARAVDSAASTTSM